MANEKKISDYNNCLEFMESNSKELPKITCFVSTDSYEFETVLDFYRENLAKAGEPFETIVFTGEGGETEEFFSHAFTPDMFYPKKILIVKSGVQFFKPFFSTTTKKPNDLHHNFVHLMPQLSDKVYIVIHYDHWEIMAGVKKLFNNQMTLIVSRNFYPGDTKKNLDMLLRKLDLHLTDDAYDEFIHRIPPNMGSYIKSLQKLKTYLNKKKFEFEDIQNVLLSRTDTNYLAIGSLFFQNRRAEFFRELDKVQDIRAEMGLILSKLLDRLNEIRVYRTLHKRFKADLPDDLLFETLGMQAYKSGRKFHIRKELNMESRYLNDRTEELMYKALVDLNLRHKTRSGDADELTLFLKNKFMQMFTYLEV